MRVLLCVDDDPVLDAVLGAIDWCVETTKWDELLLLHVMPKAPLLLTTQGQDPRAGVDAFLSSVVERLSHLPATIETMIATGDPAESIMRTAERNEVDLIVMGARGESHDFPVGSVSQKVAYLAETDVLVVRAWEASPDVGSCFRTLITVDGSQGSEAGITSFANKLRAQRATIHLVHVIESLPRLWEIGSEDAAIVAPLVRHAEQLLERTASLLAAHGLETEREWHHGSPATTILDVARRRECELIVVGSLGHTRLARLLLGPMTQRILRHAPCSVLCARAWSPERAALTSDWSSDNVEPQIGMHEDMRILLCVDDDSLYDALVDALDSTLAVGSEDEVLVAHVVATLRWLPLRGNDSGWAGTERAILQKVDDFLEQTVDVVTQKGVRAEPLRLEGDVASELLKAADEREIDVIVTGAIGQGRSQDFLVGSVAEKLLAVSERDLLLARAPTTSPSKNLRVVVAVDNTDASYQAIESFAGTCRVDDAAVEIVHVMQVPPPRFDAAPEEDESKSSIPPIVRERADHAVNRAHEIFASRGLHPRLALRRGDPAREILAAARSFEANLVVVGRGERRPGTRLAGWRGTVTKRVAQHAPCSVFIAATGPSQRHEDTEGDHEREDSRADDR